MREAPEVRFFKSGPGVATAIAIGVAAVGGALVWMRRAKGQERREREAVVIAAPQAGVAPGAERIARSCQLRAVTTVRALGFGEVRRF